MTWIPYKQAIEKRITGYPKEGDTVLFKVRCKRKDVWYQAKVEKIINHRKYIVRYEVPTEVRHHFINGTTSAIAKIDNLSFFCSTEDPESNQDGNEDDKSRSEKDSLS
jgi:hypothetical protein